jgi:transposase-like protein
MREKYSREFKIQAVKLVIEEGLLKYFLSVFI